MKFFLKLMLLTLTGVSAGLVVHAQILPSIIPDALSLAASPASPSPGQTVTIQALTPTFDKNTATFDWTVNGVSRPDLSGQGKDSISTVAGDVGSSIRVALDVTKSDGTDESSSLTVRISDLALTWFAETYVPRWYKGKALPIQDSVVDVVAVPRVIISGSSINPANLVYSWDFDDQEGVLSGVGQQVFRIRTSDLPGASHHVKVTIEDTDKQVHKKGELFIVPAIPRAVIYYSSPLGGTETRSAPDLFLTSKRGLLDFQVEPFFFSALSKSNLNYKWSVGGSEVQASSDNPSLYTVDTARQAGDTIPISVTVDEGNGLIPSFSRAITLFLQ